MDFSIASKLNEVYPSEDSSEPAERESGREIGEKLKFPVPFSWTKVGQGIFEM